MSYLLEDYNPILIYLTDGYRDFYIPKFRMSMVVEEPYLNIEYNYPEWGGNNRKIKLNYADVDVYGYGGIGSAQALKDSIDSMILSGWTDINVGDILVNKGDLLSSNGVTDEILPVGANESILSVDNSTPTGLKWITKSSVVGFSRLVNKSTSDQTTNSTSLVDITDLSIPIVANQTVYFRAVIHVGTSANNGLGYAVTIPTGATMKAMVTGQTTTAIAAGTSSSATQWITTSGSETGTINAISQANQNVIIEGWVTASSTAGTIQVQSRSTNALTTATFNSGSFITGTGN